MTWHADTTLLGRYAADALDDAQALSVEAHLLACQVCRSRVSEHAPADRLEAVWAGVVDRIDAPRPSPAERLLLWLGVPDHIARLLAATPALGTSWLVGVAATLAFVALAGSFTGDTRVVPLFLILAPVLPVVGVAVSFGPRFDPAAELAIAAPMDSFRLLLLRALAIVSATTVLTGVAAILVPAGGWTAVAWLLPAVALTAATLALGRFIPLQVGAALLATGWMIVAVSTLNPFRPAAETVLSAFGPAGQTVCLAVALVSGMVVLRAKAPPHAI